jgi:hypothetical protein
VEDSKTSKASQYHLTFTARMAHVVHFAQRGWQRLAIVPAGVIALAVIAFVVPPLATAQSTWNSEQDNCSNLYPIPTPDYFNNGSWALESPPSGWGSPMKNPSNGQDAHWSWDGTHSIVSCNTQGLYAAYTSNGGASWSESRSHSTLLSNGYGAAFQCVELILRYAYARWGDVSGWSGNASNLYLNSNHPSHFATHDNGTSYLPVAGDIVIFGPVNSNGSPNPSAGAGHISIITAVNTSAGTVTVFEQNWGPDGDGVWRGFHTLQLRVTASGGTNIYTIGNDVGGANTFGQASGGKTYRWHTDHVIYGVLTDPSNHPGGVIDPSTPSGTSSCSSITGKFLTSYCDVPSVTIACGGAIGSQNDLSGIPINWTYTNGTPTCVTVKYSFGYFDARNTCSYYLYVPNGEATTTIQATLSDGSHQSLNENPVVGWQHWFDATGITGLTFTDGNGTTNQQMGWGRTASWSIERLCSL